MKIAFLPNYYKKIGIVTFFVAAGLILTMSLCSAPCLVNTSPHLSEPAYAVGHFLGSSLAGQNDHLWPYKLCSLLLVLGVAFFMLSKEKIEDEYMDKIRWESVRLSILLSIGVALLFILIGSVITARTLLFIQFISYLIAFQVKKSNPITE